MNSKTPLGSIHPATFTLPAPYPYSSSTKQPTYIYILPAAPTRSRRPDAIVGYRRICSFAFSSTVGLLMVCLFTQQPLLPRLLFFGAMTVYLFGAVLSILILPVPEDDNTAILTARELRQRRIIRKILAVMTFNASLLLVSGFVCFKYDLALNALRAGLISFLSDVPCQTSTEISP